VPASNPAGVDEMKSLFRQLARTGLVMLLAFAALGAVPATASAQFIVLASGTATGKTIPLRDGTFRIVGTYTDASGARGTYLGTYVEDTTGYTSCPYIGFDEDNCLFQPAEYQCNRIHGEVTFRSQGKVLTLRIAIQPWYGRSYSSICLDPTNPETHDVGLWLFAGTPDDFSRGYGDLNYAYGNMYGTSTPLAGGLYANTFSFQILTD